MEPSEKLFVYTEHQVTWTDSERKGESNSAQLLFGFCCVRLRIYFRNGHVFAPRLRCQTFSSHLRIKIFMQIGMKTRENFVFHEHMRRRIFGTVYVLVAVLEVCLCNQVIKRFGLFFVKKGERSIGW